MRILATLFGVIAAAAAIPSGDEVDNSTFSSFVDDFLRGFFGCVVVVVVVVVSCFILSSVGEGR